MANGASQATLKSGITANTPSNMTFGAGVLVKNLTWSSTRKVPTKDVTPQTGKTYYYYYQSVWQEADNITEFNPMYVYHEIIPGWDYSAANKIGATKGGTKLSIVPEYTDIEIDGVLVKMKGTTVKTGETAKIETTLIENTAENAALVIGGVVSNTSKLVPGIGSNFRVVKSRDSVDISDYITNLALIANRIDDGSQEPMVVIFKNSLCTSGFEIETKNKDISAFKAVFECVADLNSDVSTSLPYELIYPNVSENM